MHAPRVNFRDAPATTADFEERHAWLSTAEDSPFVRTFVMYRRDAEGADLLRGRVLTRIDAAKGKTERELGGEEELFDVIGGVFGRRLDDLIPADRAVLWDRVGRAHAAWLASRS